MEDPILGEVTVRADEFSCHVQADGQPIELVVFLCGAPQDQGFSIARKLASALPELVPRAWQEAADGCLPLINGGYLHPGETPLTREDFIRRATLSGLSIDTDANISFHFHDDDMLWGHYITVHCTLDAASWDVQMSG
jgi:hypothetical protein